jgi:hypothetical protein
MVKSNLTSKTPSLSLRLRIASASARVIPSGICPVLVRCLSGPCPLPGLHFVRFDGVTMEDKFQHVLNALPDKPPRSRLGPYGELIDELRRRGRTYREIARILAEQCQLQVSRSTINDFVRVRSKAIRKSRKGQALRAEATAIRSSSGVTDGRRAAETPRANQTAADEVLERIAELKRRPHPPESKSHPFQYDPSKPLHIPQKTGSDGTGK